MVADLSGVVPRVVDLVRVVKAGKVARVKIAIKPKKCTMASLLL